MNTQVEKLEKSQVKVTVTVGADKIEPAIDKAYQTMKKDFNIPGFRKGKATRAVIEKMYGVEVFFNKAADIIIDTTLWEAVDENKLDMAARIRPNELEVTEMTKETMTYTAIITVKPEVTLGEYKEVEVEVAKVAVTEEEIDEKVKAEAEKNAREITITDRAIDMDDKVVIDFEGFVDGEAFEGGKGTDYPLVIGSKSFIDTFEDQLIGKNIGEEVEVNVTFPAEYHVESLANKPALFKVAIKSITQKELPEINDEFASEVSEFETLAEYKEDIKATLLTQKEENHKAEIENKSIEQAAKNATVEIPDAMIEEQVERNINSFATRMKYQGLELEQYLQFTGQTVEALKENFKPDAEAQIRTRLVLEKIAEAEEIAVSDDDVNEELEKLAKHYQMPLEQLQSSFAPYEKEALVEDVKIQKAAKLVADSAKVVEK